MLTVSAILVAAIALFAVAYPIIRRSGSTLLATVSAQETLDELLAQRDAAFQALRELNFDHRVGKITNEDFMAFEAHLKQVAANALRALDDWEAETDDALERAIEHAVRQRRAVLATSGRACSACGRLASPEDKFCAGCGQMLPAESTPVEVTPPPLTCPACGQSFQSGDRFCAGCGRTLPG